MGVNHVRRHIPEQFQIAKHCPHVLNDVRNFWPLSQSDYGKPLLHLWVSSTFYCR